MRAPRVVLDTNVLVAASRSARGASAKLLSLVGSERFHPVISVPLVIEYEDALMRGVEEWSPKRAVLEDILDYICLVAKRHQIFFLWRPHLKDPKDDMVLEIAVAAQCDAIVTYNIRDFRGVDTFGLEVLRPKEFLDQIGALE